MKYEVIFYDCTDDETVVEQKFNYFEEAIAWAEDKQYEYYDEWYNGDTCDYEFKLFYRYYNPETADSNLYGYEVRLIV